MHSFETEQKLSKQGQTMCKVRNYRVAIYVDSTSVTILLS